MTSFVVLIAVCLLLCYFQAECGELEATDSATNSSGIKELFLRFQADVAKDLASIFKPEKIKELSENLAEKLKDLGED